VGEKTTKPKKAKKIWHQTALKGLDLFLGFNRFLGLEFTAGDGYQI